tara:strand:+ start:216 stop:365 length:150 start_codon:yes stop_codon:yes gene_type:complete
MANAKISELTELVSPQNTDVMPIVDTLNDQTKKVTIENIRAIGFDDGTY